MKPWPAGVLSARATEVKVELATCADNAGRTSAWADPVCGLSGRMLSRLGTPQRLSLDMDFAKENLRSLMPLGIHFVQAAHPRVRITRLIAL
jgi:hypothetical protein